MRLALVAAESFFAGQLVSYLIKCGILCGNQLWRSSFHAMPDTIRHVMFLVPIPSPSIYSSRLVSGLLGEQQLSAF